MLARPVDSEIVCERALCSVKCSVVTNEIADARGSPAASGAMCSPSVTITSGRRTSRL